MQYLKQKYQDLSNFSDRSSEVDYQIQHGKNMVDLSLSNEKKFYELREEWEALLNQAEDPDFFSSWEWNYCWWKNFKEDGELFLLTFRNDNKNLVGIFPGYILSYSYYGVLKLKVLQFIGRGINQKSIGEYSDFLDIIVHPEFRIQVYELLVNYLKNRNGLFDIIYLNVLKETSPFVSYLKNDQKKNFKLNRIENDLPVYFASLPDTLDDYLRELSSSFRSSFKRKVRKWEKNHNARLCVIEDSESIEDFFTNFFSLVRKRHKKIMANARVNFHKDIARHSLERNRFLGIYTKLEGKYSAVAVIYVFKNKAYFYQHAINPKFSEHSPGMVLFYYMYQKIIEDGINQIEFLHGKYDYKKRFGKEQHYLVNIHLGMGTLKSKLYFFLYTNVQRSKKIIKRILGRD